MGFKSVYRALQELFPQVDARLLKAAAIEHPKDPNGAVEFILTEVLPYTSKLLDTSSSSIASLGYLSSVENERSCVAELVASSCASSSKHVPNFPGGAANKSEEKNEPYHVDPACLNETVLDSLNSTLCDTKTINDNSSGNTVEAAYISEKMNEPNLVDLTPLHETVPGSRNSTFDAKDINDQLSGTTVEASNRLAEINEPRCIDSTSLHETLHGSLGSTFCESKDIGGQPSGSTGTRELTASRACEEINIQAVHNVSFNSSVSHAYEEVNDGDHNKKSENSSLDSTATLQKYKDLELCDANYSLSSSAVLDDAVLAYLKYKEHISFDPDNNPISRDLNGSVLVECQNKRSSAEIISLSGSNYVELASLSVNDRPLESLDCSPQLEVQCVMSSSNGGMQCDKIVDVASREDSHIPDSVNIKESSAVHTLVTRSGQLFSTDLLEDMIEDSKSHKKTLFSAMDSVLKLMREVELKEKVAQQAKEEAAKGGFEILAKVDELKRMLNNAREANAMHSGEVFAERAILATEMRELQSHLIALSDEKDKSLSILDTMLEALEIQLAAAEAKRIAAEQEKFAKEESAWKVLAEQELIMEKVVQESKMLQHEAEQNAKLRELLVDRGCAVDMLQGEISVICQDVNLLKENTRAPQSQYLSSKQSSSILASSGSSLKSSGSQEVLVEAEWSTPFDEPILLSSVEQVTDSDQDELVDEGWELFDNAA